jgi:hypothetical protein
MSAENKIGSVFALLLVVAVIAGVIHFMSSSNDTKAAKPAQQFGLQTQPPPVAKPEPEKVYTYAPPVPEIPHAKKIVEGVVWTVKWNGNDPAIGVDKEKTHYQPDNTEVETYEPGTDDKPEYTYFCGDALARFTPGKRIRMILEDTNVSDYNSCYTLKGVGLTFGGKPQAEVQLGTVMPSSVPGAK